MSIGRVVDRLSRVYKDAPFNINDVAAWCFDVVEESGIFTAMEQVTDMHLLTENGRVMLPCNIYRLLKVSTCCGCSGISYERNENCLVFNNLSPKEVYVDALVIKTDDMGFPIIDPVLNQACYWYCVMKHHEPTMGQRGSAYDRASIEYYQSLREAKGSFRGTSAEDLAEVMRIVRGFNLPRMTSNA